MHTRAQQFSVTALCLAFFGLTIGILMTAMLIATISGGGMHDLAREMAYDHGLSGKVLLIQPVDMPVHRS